MKSIMQRKDGTCYLCEKLYSDCSIKPVVQEHHAIFGTANRDKSEHYGLKVYLCLYHHIEGEEAVHNNAENALIVKQDAQRAFTRRFPNEDWMSIFGKNFLYDEEETPERCIDGFRFIEV